MSELFVDLYGLRMAAGYLRQGMTEPATFSLFARHLPRRRRFLVAAGLAEALAFLEDFGFDQDDLAFLRDTAGLDEPTLEALAGMRFTGEVRAVPEGRVVFPDEPLLEVTAPIAQAQLVETGLLNAVTYATAIASGAARCRIAVGGADLFDLSCRRAHGRQAALTASRVSAMVGFTATSNVAAAKRFGLPLVGTMAHSFIEALGGDSAAFEEFDTGSPIRTEFLVDTFEAKAGIQAAIDAIGKLGPADRVGIRLDSGDLADQAFTARLMLDAAGLTQVRITATGGLDEHAIAALVAAGAPIDAYGVGTRLGTGGAVPFLDTVYMLVDYGGRPMMKLTAGKATLPGAKQIFRGPDGDVLGLRDDPAPAGHTPMLVEVMRGGQRTEAGRDAVSPAASSRRFDADLAWLPDPASRLSEPVLGIPSYSRALTALYMETAGLLTAKAAKHADARGSDAQR